MTTDPIQLIDIGPATQRDREWGYEGPGWYFWEETWADAHGPYKSREEAREKLTEYCWQYLGPPDEKIRAPGNSVPSRLVRAVWAFLALTCFVSGIVAMILRR